MRKLFHDNGLSLVLFGLFILLWSAQLFSGWKVLVEESSNHNRPAPSLGDYLQSGHFWQATGENWESEFLQMGAYVFLTSFLFQRGSAESKDPDGPPPEATTAGFVKRNSLSLGFCALFVASFMLHAHGGWRESNRERELEGLPAENLAEFLSGSTFWFQSFQNWQSEFLAVFSIVVLSIFLRQHGSPESKKISDPVSKTGSS